MFQKEDGNQCCPNLGLERIGCGPDKGLDLEVLLDGLEEDFSLPAVLVNGGDGGGTEHQVVYEQDNGFFLIFIPYLYSSQPVRIAPLCRVQNNDLVFQNIPVLWNSPFLDQCVIGIVFLSCHEKDSFLVPPGKEGIARITPVTGDNGLPGKGEALCDVDLMTAPLV